MKHFDKIEDIDELKSEINKLFGTMKRILIHVPQKDYKEYISRLINGLENGLSWDDTLDKL